MTSHSIQIKTRFDITRTGVIRPIQPRQLPIKVNGTEIKTFEEWLLKRNQQSNYETVIQTISLRTQPLNIKEYQRDKWWFLEYDIEFASLYAEDGDELGLLKSDFSMLPMITGLTETVETPLVVVSDNTFFNFINR